jgi:hypothetical protein
MAASEKEKLKRIIEEIEGWRATRPPEAIYSAFEFLEGLDQSKNADLWDELRQAIEENKDFKWKPFKDFMKPFSKRAKEGFWWWNAI